VEPLAKDHAKYGKGGLLAEVVAYDLTDKKKFDVVDRWSRREVLLYK